MASSNEETYFCDTGTSDHFLSSHRDYGSRSLMVDFDDDPGDPEGASMSEQHHHNHFRSLPPIPEYEYFTGEGEMDFSHATSHSDLAMEWSMLCQECTDCWTGTGRGLVSSPFCLHTNCFFGV